LRSSRLAALKNLDIELNFLNDGLWMKSTAWRWAA
jgi:uncharacterized protein YhdP